MISSSARAYREGAGAGSPTPDSVAELARTRFGVPYLYPLQRFVLSNTLEGRPQIVILPTGSGKSLCFQLPALLLPGPTLVLVPLLSLLADQLRAMRSAGIPVGELRGGLEPEEKARLFDGIRSGRTRLVLATPEACLAEPNLSRLASCGFSHLVVDEAHCLSEWGDSFRPAYREVGTIARRLAVPMISAFTATASAPVIARIRSLLFADGEVRLVEGGADRPNISYRVVPVLSRRRALAGLVREAPRPLLAFFRTRGGAEIAAREARRRFPGSPVTFYHAGLAREERGLIERWFLGSRDGALFATCAYGMGVDKPDIRTVAHADVPLSVEAYLQETGRAGRDGAPSSAVLLVSAEDDAFLGRIEEATARERYGRVLGYARGGGACRRQQLLALIGQPPPACAGCDVCDGTAALLPEGAPEILGFLRAHRRSFAPAQAADILAGARGPRTVRGYDDCRRGFGSLSSWDVDDVEEAIRALCAAGSLRLLARGPWKGNLTTG